MKNITLPTKAPAPTPAEVDIRDYAYHLYEQNGRLAGHDLEHWLEAKACLEANIPRHHARSRLQRHVRGLGPAEQEELCTSSAETRNLAL